MNKNDIRKKINDSKIKKAEMVKNIIVGSSSLLLLTPIYLANMNEESIPTAIFTAIEIGALYIPIKAIKTIRCEKRNLKLYKKELNNTPISKEQIKINDAYRIVIDDIKEQEKITPDVKKKQKLNKLRKKVNSICK